MEVTNTVGAAEGWILGKLVADAAAIQKVKQSITATQHGLAVVGELIGEAETRPKIVVIVWKETAGRAVASGNDQGAGREGKVGLAIENFDGPGKDVVAESEIQSQTRRHTVIVLGEEPILPGARADHAKTGAVRIAVDKACEQVGDLVAGTDVPLAWGGSAAPAVAIAGDGEVAFARERTK